MTTSTDRPILFGAPYSVYVCAVRLALDEKGVDYELVPVDIFTPGGPSKEHLARHPFGKIPAFEHAGFRLYEAGATGDSPDSGRAIVSEFRERR
jgi:glutathione S-transferase